MSSFKHTGTVFALGLLAGALSPSTAHAQTPATALRLDEGFTWLSVRDNPQSNPVGNLGWRIVANLRAFGTPAASSAFKLVVRQGNRTLGTARCPGRIGQDRMTVTNCGGSVSEWQGGDPHITAVGEFTVDVLYVNGQTDQETPLRTLRTNVERLERVSEGNWRPEPPVYVVNADARRVDAIIRQVPPRGERYLSSGGSFENASMVELVTIASPRDRGSNLGSSSNALRCTANGAPVPIRLDQVTSNVLAMSWGVATRRPRTGNERIEEPSDWRQIVYRLPLTYGAQRWEGAAALEEFPGVWICEIRQNSQVLRTFRFTVRDGNIQSHPEEAQGLYLGLDAHLVEFWAPVSELANDRPLPPNALRPGGFYGHAWASAEQRAVVAAPGQAPAVPAPSAAASAAPNTATTPGAAAPAASSLRYDHGYVWLEAVNHVQPVNGRPVNQGWSLSASARVWGSTPARSAFRFVVKQGTRTLGEVRCEGNRTTGGDERIAVTDCGNNDSAHVGGPMRIPGPGSYTVEVHFVDGASDQSSLVQTHRIDVLAATGIRGNNQPDATNYYVNHNAELLSNYIVRVPQRIAPPFDAWPRTENANTVYLVIHTAPGEQTTNILRDYGNQLRCRVNDQPIELRRTQTTAREAGNVAVVHTRQNPASAANPTRDVVMYRRYVLQMPLTFGDPAWQDATGLGSQAGNWACDWRNNGRTIRTFRFTTTADGNIAAHPEEAQGAYFGPEGHLVETVIPADNPADIRSDPAAIRTAGFYGRPWATEQGRAMAAAVPAIGTPAPPQPRGR